jgi:hypothetical protein
MTENASGQAPGSGLHGYWKININNTRQRSICKNKVCITPPLKTLGSRATAILGCYFNTLSGLLSGGTASKNLFSPRVLFK